MYEFPETIFSAIRQEVDDFTYNSIELVEGHTFSQYDTIKKTHLYYNSHFVEGDYEYINGVPRKKFFYNISKWRADVASKMLDQDIKDIMLLPKEQRYDFMVRLLRKEFELDLQRGKFSKLLNRIAHELPIYGSVLVRKTKDGAELIDLRHLFIDQAAESVQDARYINIKHFMTPSQLRKKKNVWKNVDDVINNYCTFSAGDTRGYENAQGLTVQTGAPLAEIYERFGEVPLSYFTGSDSEDDENTFVLARFIVAGVYDTLKNDKGEYAGENGKVLFAEKLSELPLMEIHYNKTPGRWLGIGVVEDTFEAQRRKNELENQKAKAMELSSLILFQTRAESNGRNLLSDFENGDIVRTSQEITRVQTEERDLGSYQTASAETEKLADRITFSYDVLRGESSPASSTAYAVNTQLQQASSIFDFKKEDFSNALVDFISYIYLPTLKDKLKKQHIIRYTGSLEDVDFVRKSLVTYYVDKEIIKKTAETGVIPSAEIRQQLIDNMSNELIKRDGNVIWAEVVDNFFDELDRKIIVVISGENKNVFGELNSIDQLLAGIVRNPQALQDPLVRTLILDRARTMGMDVAKLENIINQQKGQEVQQLPEQNANTTIPQGGTQSIVK